MTYCVTPGCFQPQNPDSGKFCFTCGSKLWLKDKYRPLKPLGKGGFGRTFLAVDEENAAQTRCVIKQLYIENKNTLILKKATELFHREAERLNELGQHPKIPALIDHLEQQKHLYLIQEFIDGETLEQELKLKGAFNETQIKELLEDLLPVLKYIHDRQVLHRDIKPANIMRRHILSQGGEKNNLVLIDFGVSKVITDTALYRTGTITGSPGYMAPEQEKGKPLPASDIYSLGVTCIKLLTDVAPFDMFDTNENRWAWRDFLTKDKQVSDRLARILDKMLKPAVNQRYKSVAEVLQAIQQPTTPVRQTPPPAPTNVNFFTKLFHPQAVNLLKGNLLSEAGVDYSRLEYFIRLGQWKQADNETHAVLCQIVGKSPNSNIQIGDIDKFPCEDLEIINKLWVKHSKSRFGFSVQKEIFESVDEDYGQFCFAIGWPSHDSHSPYLKYNLSAPMGHLPSRTWVGGYQWWRHAAAMASKLDKCQIG